MVTLKVVGTSNNICHKFEGLTLVQRWSTLSASEVQPWLSERVSPVVN